MAKEEAAIRERWECNDEDCENEFCFPMPEGGGHFELDEDNIPVWAAANVCAHGPLLPTISVLLTCFFYQLKGDGFANINKPPHHHLFDGLHKNKPRPSLIAQRAAEQAKQTTATATPLQPVINNHVSFPAELVAAFKQPVAPQAEPNNAPALAVTSIPADPFATRRLSDNALLSLDGRHGKSMGFMAFCKQYMISDTLRERLEGCGYDGPELLPDTNVKDLKEAGFKPGELQRLRHALTSWVKDSGEGLE